MYSVARINFEISPLIDFSLNININININIGYIEIKWDGTQLKYDTIKRWDEYE